MDTCIIIESPQIEHVVQYTKFVLLNVYNRVYIVYICSNDREISAPEMWSIRMRLLIVAAVYYMCVHVFTVLSVVYV